MDLHEKEKMYQRLIIFTLLIGMVIYYFEKIFCFLGWIGQMCLPFLLGAGLAFVFNIISNNLMRYSIKWFDIKDTKIKRIISNVLSVLIVFCRLCRICWNCYTKNFIFYSIAADKFSKNDL